MSTPDPEGMSLLAKVAAAGAVVLAPVIGAWKYFDWRLDKKADKDMVIAAFEKVDAEMTIQRGNIGKLFDQNRENEQRAQDRHERLMGKLK